MALSKITYDNKVSLNPQPGVAEVNKVTDANMNEIKSVVNGAIDYTVEVSNQTTAMVGQKFVFNNGYVIYAGTVVVSFSNGIGNFDITGLNLSAKPSCVQATICSENYGIKYNYDSSTSTSLRFELFNNGSIYSKTGNVRFSCTIFEKLSS